MKPYMAGTRGILASIGASAALVAAVALSLLAVSAALTFTELGEGIEGPAQGVALVFAASSQADAAGSRETVGETLLLDAPSAPARPASRPAGDGAARARSDVREMPARPLTLGPTTPNSPPPDLDPSNPITAPPPPRAPATPAAVKPAPRTADALRRVGEGLSSGAQSAAAAVEQIAALLAPAVSRAVQDVLDIAAALLRRTTSGLGGTLDPLP